MFTKVLIATDASPASNVLVSRAKQLYSLGTRECVLAQCFSIRELVPFPDEIKTYIENSMVEQRRRLEQQGLKATVVAEPGIPGREIPRIAAEQGCSLILIGSHGHNVSGDILLGSTATDILYQATLPVLLIRINQNEDTGPPPSIKNDWDFRQSVLYATDFSQHAELAFGYLAQVVQSGASHVTLLHVQEKAKLELHLKHRLEEFNKTDRERLTELKRRLEAIGKAEIDLELPYGSPIQEILNRANAGDISLVIMGRHGRGFVSELFLGSVSHNIIRHCHVPVLLIR